MSQSNQSRSSVGLTRRQTQPHRQLIVPPIVNTAQQHPGTAAVVSSERDQARLAGELKLDTGYAFEELIPDLSGRERIVMFNADHEKGTGPDEFNGEDDQGDAHEKNSLFSRSPTPAPDDPGPANDFEPLQPDAEDIVALLGMYSPFLGDCQGRDDTTQLETISDLPDVMISFHRKPHLFS
jgi:hypothetical protein